ncbi:hypothetical protein AUC69_14755 [Methyloceanibacter superfactus]|uniref:Uncharacterized protein n=1 Tax=Methyloceanibacter superfactus TaxID=1774969 RepID=A0A1E3VTY8_9HYPH|nr:hypothetical protein AUC69_14755 [Methyloceanibacter superfactus]
MRLLVGIILGAVLTIIGVYIVDMGADGTEQRHMVNWDVVGARISDLTSGLKRSGPTSPVRSRAPPKPRLHRDF